MRSFILFANCSCNLQVDEIAALLNAADTELIPFIALQAFGGLRRAEAERIQWEAVDFDNGLILVSAKIAKNGIARHVEINETLKAWLMTERQLSGSVRPPNSRKLMDAARDAAQRYEWPKNALRHSAASYHLAAYKDAGRTAEMLGHPNPRMLFKHDRALVKPKDAARWWAVMPGTADQKTVAIA